MRRRAMTESHTSVQSDTSSRSTAPIYSHVSTYRSLELELQLYSPSLKMDSRSGPVAVFNTHDQIGGKVLLDWSAHRTGNLKLSVEGAFIYPRDSESSYSESRRHVFFNHSHVIPVSGESSRFTFRDAFMKRRPSASHLSSKSGQFDRSYPFQFPFPQGSQPGQELPPSFASQANKENPLVMTSEISYKMIATWEPDALGQSPSHLEIPFILEHDADFQSADALNGVGDAWLEVPLVSERPMPIRIAIALPNSTTFCRKSSIPYFVVFSTTPRSSAAAREIAADSTIYVSLTRQIVINEPQTMMLLTPPPSPIVEEPEPSPRHSLLRRVARSSARLSRKRRHEEIHDKPLPHLPPNACFSESKTVHNDFFVGFPKRPRHRCASGKHPSLEEQSSLPDGLLKSKISLDERMLPCINWAGVTVKYYLTVTVSIGQDDWRARLPIRIF